MENVFKTSNPHWLPKRRWSKKLNSMTENSKSMKYFLGVDAGGTKTHALLSDAGGNVLGFGHAGPGNWEGVGLDGLTQSLRNAVTHSLDEANIAIEQISSCGMGLAGYDWPSQKSMILGAIQPLGLKCPVEIVNDTTLGIFAGTEDGWGVSIVSGTGCNCRGWSKDLKREGRVVGGGSHWSGEYAGGYDIAARAMRAVTFEWTKRGSATALSQAFIKQLVASDLDDLVEGIYVGRYEFDQETIRLVFRIAAEGDNEALKVIRWAGQELGDLACGVIHQLQLENDSFDVVLIGSLFEGHPLMQEALGEKVRETAPNARLIRLNAPPVIGGVVLGMQIHGLDTRPLRGNLLATMAVKNREVQR
jgi:N-acetylglucosamine kinase-like BadF-type ATPase